MSVWGAIAKAGVDMAGKLFDAKENKDNLAAQLNLSRDTMMHGIRWKVKDAKAAGIHPLYALGASGPTFSPISVGSSTLGQGIADTLNELGQDISRAQQTEMTGEQRQAATLGKLAVERAELENELLRSQISKINSAQMGPPAPNPNVQVGNEIPDSSVKIVPKEQTATAPGIPSAEAGVSPEVAYIRTPGGGLAMTRSMDAKERLEEDFFGSMAYALRNNIVPIFTGKSPHEPPAELLPEGALGWDYYNLTNEWKPRWPYPRKKRRGLRIYPRQRNPFTGK
ncbi:MAG: hypothetical protein QXT77_08615 [Candidatus Methanomethylicaceae archaeon]